MGSQDRDRCSNDRDKISQDRDRYLEDRDRYSEDRDRYSEERDRYSNEGEPYYHTKTRYPLDKEKDPGLHNTKDWEKHTGSRDRYATDRLGYAADTDTSTPDLYEKESYPYRAPDRYQGFEEEEDRREGTMFFHRRQISEPSIDTLSHVSYGK